MLKLLNLRNLEGDPCRAETQGSEDESFHSWCLWAPRNDLVDLGSRALRKDCCWLGLARWQVWWPELYPWWKSLRAPWIQLLLWEGTAVTGWRSIAWVTLLKIESKKEVPGKLGGRRISLLPRQAMRSPFVAPCWQSPPWSQLAKPKYLPSPSPSRPHKAEYRREGLKLRDKNLITAQYSINFYWKKLVKCIGIS